MRHSVGLLVVALCVLAACGERALLHAYQPVDADGWHVTDTLRFALPPSPRGQDYAVSVGVRATERIPYRDLWLVVESRIMRRHRDTLHLLLASDRAHWQTGGVILHDIEDRAATIHLDSAQTGELLIYHIMSPQSVAGLTEVGVKVEAQPR